MDIELLVKSFVGLISILAVLIFFLLYASKKKKEKLEKNIPKKSTPSTKVSSLSLESLLEIIKDKKTSSKELANTLDLVMKHHGKITPKLGLRPHPDFNIYGEIVLRICRHPNTTKKIILNFDKALEAQNEEYKKDINDFITKGLNSRGA